MELYYSPQQVVVDATGTPRAGAKLNFYAAGTSTRENTYSDSALSVAHTNPVVADSEGRFPAIYFGTANDYKAVLTDSADVVIYTQDNIQNSQVKTAQIPDNAITTVKILDEAITLAKMADLARGSLIVGGASNRPTALAYSDSGKVLTTKGVSANPAWESLPLPTGYKTGLTLSLGADTDHDITVAAGSARDSTDTANIVGTSLTKRIDASWAAGDGNGGMATGTVAADTTYYFYAIVKDSDSTVDYMFDTSASAANIPSGYTNYLLLDTLLTDSSSNLINSMNGKYVSSVFTAPAAASETTLVHGLGARPTKITLWAVATATTDGYTIGDIVQVGIMSGSAASSGHGFDVSDPTTIILQWGTNAPLFRHKTAGTNVDAEVASYDVYVTAEL